MDWDGRVHPLVDPPLPQVPGVQEIWRQAIHCPILSLPPPNSPGITAIVDYFGPLHLTPRGNSYILLFTDRFSPRADMYVVTATQFTTAGTADILVDQYIPLWG